MDSSFQPGVLCRGSDPAHPKVQHRQAPHPPSSDPVHVPHCPEPHPTRSEPAHILCTPPPSTPPAGSDPAHVHHCQEPHPCSDPAHVHHCQEPHPTAKKPRTFSVFHCPETRPSLRWTSESVNHRKKEGLSSAYLSTAAVRGSNGVTHIFYKGQYFTCYDENDPEWKLVIFNSKREKLETTRNDRVELRIKEAIATVSSTRPEPSAWCVRKAEIDTKNMYAHFNTIKLRAALDAADSEIEVAEFCGIVPIFKYGVPSSEII